MEFSMTHEQEIWWTLRTWILILKSALDDGDLTLARNSIKEMINIISDICYMYNLYNIEGDEETKQLEGVKER